MLKMTMVLLPITCLDDGVYSPFIFADAFELLMQWGCFYFVSSFSGKLHHQYYKHIYMEKLDASYLPRIRKKVSIRGNKSNKAVTVEMPQQCFFQSFLDWDNAESEGWDLEEFVSIRCYSDEKEPPIENPFMDSLGECMLKSSPDSESDEAEVGLEAISRSLNENKQSLDAIEDKPAPFQDFQTQKKYKPDESLKLKVNVGSVVAELHHKSEVPETPVTEESTSEKLDQKGSSGKRRLSRCDKKPEVEGETGEGYRTRKRRKTRWTGDDSQLKLLGPIQLPDFMKDVTSDLDAEIQELKVELFEINGKLQRPDLHDDRPEEDRSPSPEAVYDYLGNRQNKREVRLREKLIQKRQHIISRLIGRNSTFQPAADYKPPKLVKKLYIPEKEYPGYNFVGLIIGPRGRTQKRMERETGAKILLRGKGYSLRTARKTKASDSEDLHVRIEADNQNSFDAAVRMVEQLLLPIDLGKNIQQQAELAKLGKLNAESEKNLCQCSFDEGHPYYACLHQRSTLETSQPCDICGSDNHATPSCTSIGLETSSTQDIQSKPNKETIDEDLFVGYLPQTVDENRLTDLFAPFGKIEKTKVIKDRATGISKGYGFIKFENSARIASASSRMNGNKIDGKTLVVREGSRQWVTGPSVLSPDTNHLGPVAASQDALYQTGWPGPLGSSLQQHQTMFPETQVMATPPHSTYSLRPFGFFPMGLGFPPVSSILYSQGKNGLEYGHIPHSPFSSPWLLNYPGSQYETYFATQTFNPSSSFQISPGP